MGRHAAPPPDAEPPLGAGQLPGAEPHPDGSAPAAPDAEHPTHRPWWEHAVLATVAALAVGGVMAWAGGIPWIAVLGGLATAVVVAAAGWLAGRLPHHGAAPG